MEGGIEEKDKMRPRDWKWIVSILITIIIFLLTAIFLNITEKISISDLISIGSGLVSIALAIVAIIIAVAESVKSSNKEEKVQVGLDKIISNTDTMRDLIHKLEKLEKEVTNTNTEVKSLRKAYKESEKSFILPNEESQELKYTQDEKPIQQTNGNQQEVERENPNVSSVNLEQFMTLTRGDIYFADLSPVVGSELGGVRPVLVVSNDIANKFSPVINIAPITAQIQKAKLPTHVEIDAKRWGFEKDSVIIVEQTLTVDKQRLKDKITHLDEEMMNKVDEALSVQLGLIDF